MKQAVTWKLPLLLFVLFVAMQLPFIGADPDRYVDVNTRGAWIDEGLYNFQTREWVDSGVLDTEINDAFIRSPVFQGLTALFFLIFGTNLWAARLVTVLLVALAIALVTSRKKMRTFGLVLAAVVATQFHVFQFSHYALVYMSAISWLIMSMIFLTEAIDGIKPFRNTFLATLFVFLAYGTTVQLLAAVLLLPAVAFIHWVSGFFQRERRRPGVFLMATGFTIVFGLLYLLAWYLPHKEFFNTIVFYQTEGRFPKGLSEFWDVIQFNFDHFLWVVELIPYFVLAAISLILWPVFIRRHVNQTYRTLFVFAFFWLLMELPKIGMYYIPFRYLLSFIMAMGIIIVVLLSSAFRLKQIWVIASGLIVAGLLVSNMIYNVEAFSRRSYEIKAANTYFSERVPEGTTVLGAWAPTFTWDAQVKCVPVWNNYMNFDHPIEKHKPSAIVSEMDESESDRYYESNGYRLFSMNDSSKIMGVWRYNIAFYWLKK